MQILGLDILETNGSIIGCGRKLLTFPPREILHPPTDVFPEMGSGSIGLITRARITIPPASEMEIVVKTKIPVGKGTWWVGDSVCRRGVMVANAIVNPCGSELIPVRDGETYQTR